MLNKEKDDRITELLTEYEVAKKDQEISLLESKDQINALTIQRSNRQRIIYGLVASMLLISAIALVVLLRLKSRTTRKLEEKNAIISQALREKDVLLREIHHRVKNNLQMISALLYLHGKSLTDSSAQEALRESQNRVQSMAMIHQNLYQDENLLHVGVKGYLDKLLSHLADSYSIKSKGIAIRPSVDVRQLDVDTVVPLALIINELISNSLKYAFRDGRKGKVNILIAERDQKIVVEVSDDGMGLPEDFKAPTGSGFGYKLINILAERLNASVHTTSGNGTCVTVTVPVTKAA
jgi:two-component sensor histidine kinase